MRFVILLIGVVLAVDQTEQLVLQRGLDPHRLLSEIRQAQASDDQEYFPKYAYPPRRWQRQKGIYDSFVHLNFRNSLLRNGYKFPDANAFVSMFVLEALIESQHLMPSLNVTDAELLPGIEAVLSHKDQNSPDENLFSFWQQERDDGGHFRSTAPNIEIPLGDLEQGLTLIQKAFQKLKLRKYAETVGKVLGFEQLFVKVFRIPSDADDTGVAMALSTLVLKSANVFPKSAKLFEGFGNSIKSFAKYSYNPFAEYPKNAIDPRTYVWIRKFVQEQKVEKLQLITTWMQSSDEIEVEVNYRRSPFNVNNVDLSVVANALYGLTSHALYQGGKLDMDLYLDNVRLIVWSLKNNIVEVYRTNALLYYPPKMAFYWFVSRVYKSLATFKGRFPYHEFKQVKYDLKDALRKYAVKQVLKSSECVANLCYWDDFLGNGDQFRGKLRAKYEDRVFTTSMALNMLMDTYVGQKLPSKERRYVKGGLKFLQTRAGSFARENAFFSSSVKNGDCMPNYLPHNSIKFLNGTSIDCTAIKTPFQFSANASSSIVASVAGVMSEEEYQQAVGNQVCFGKSVPKDFETQELNNATFPYWSSEALTNSMALLAMVKGQQ